MPPRRDRDASDSARSDPPAGARQVARGSWFAAVLVVGAVGLLRHGLHAPPAGKALAADRPPTSAPATGPLVPGQPVPAGPSPAPSRLPPGQPNANPAPAPPPASPVDPRVARTLMARIQLRSGSASLWTELRRLGVGVSWPPVGEPHWTLDERVFNRALGRLARRVDRRPQNARLLHTASGFHALPALPGRVLDRDAARKLVMAALARASFLASLEAAPLGKPASLKLTLPLRAVAPAVTADHLGAINTLLASYSTGLGSSSRNRRHNIRVACAAIDGTVLMPGEVFSYNQTVGPRTERAGFRTAPVIIHGELVPGTGGGVCQVSTTLYNVALLGDLKIVRRTHHHFPVHYVPAGRDATVAYGSLDLRFANSLPGPVALDVKTVGSRVVVHLYGTAASKRDVRLVTRRVIRARLRPATNDGAAGSGKRVVVTRIVRLDSGAVRREVISHDTYAPPPASLHASSSHQRRNHHRRPAGGTRKSPVKEQSPTADPVVRASQPPKGP